ETEWRAAFMLAFHVVELLGRQECNEASTNELARLRLLIPIAKLYTAKQAVAVASEALESFGGAGYIEDTGLPRLLRDAQVLPIWEGTTNVLALDVERVLRGAHEGVDRLGALIADLDRRLATAAPSLGVAADQVRAAIAALLGRRAAAVAGGEDAVQASARSFAL